MNIKLTEEFREGDPNSYSHAAKSYHLQIERGLTALLPNDGLIWTGPSLSGSLSAEVRLDGGFFAIAHDSRDDLEGEAWMAMPGEDGSQGFTLHRVRREKGNDELVAMELRHDNPGLELLGELGRISDIVQGCRQNVLGGDVLLTF